jgi:hypothetical protein
MRVTVTLPDRLVERAMVYSKSATKSGAVKEAVKCFVRYKAEEGLAAAFGAMPDFSLDPDPKMLELDAGKVVNEID